MKLKKLKNPNYCATIAKIDNIIPLENCDNIAGAIVLGSHVIVQKNAKIGDIGVFFPVECKLSNSYLSNNNLYRHKKLNVNVNKKGYFEDNGRLRLQKFQGHKSEGLFMPIESLIYASNEKSLPKLGDEFDELNGIPICEKYIVKQNKTGGTGQGKQKNKFKNIFKLIEGQFHLHPDTKHLKRNLHLLTPESIISISKKIHGCVSEDTIIETLEYGNKTIKEIVDNKLDCRIKAFDVNTNEIIFVPIDNYYFKKNHGEWYEIELENGKKIKITSNNPVWLPDLNCYREVKDLKVDDVLLFD
jgi:hypothetical protein